MYIFFNFQSNGEDNSEVCHETKEIYDSPIGKLLRHKSKVLYESAYNDLIKWAGDNKVTRFTESALLDYFGQLAKYYKGSTLWSKYSMLKKQLVAKHNVHLAIYYKLISFIKRTNSNYSPKKSRALTREQFDDFIDNAPDDDYLSTKVILIFGVTGACRCHELKELTVDDIQDTGELVSVKISDPESRKTRSFTVVGGKYLGLYRKYAALRPLCMNHRRFFIKFQKGKCFRSVVGVQAISSATQRVASYLNLPNVNEYTGYCLRRTSAKFLGLSAHDSQIVKSDTITS
ncbi:hypothetical protein AAG570_007107 [Ranatra chinensis]|uniref:Tyr recombinase domain-containing protein n=1 Tax=Ranatra chinensis TaxID=642074 RepID=A0ABD0XUX7_9HEMI